MSYLAVQRSRRRLPLGGLRAFLLASACVSALLLSSCRERGEAKGEPNEPTASTKPTGERRAASLQGKTMGTTWSVVVVTTSAEQSRAAVALQPRIEALLERVNDLMSTYRPQSELSRFNRHASTEPFPVSPETALVVRRALEIGEATGGAFDATLGPVIDLWGFDDQGRREAPPSDEELAKARARVGLEKVRVEGDALVKTQPDVDLNLSGIAKGYGVDVVHALVREAGFTDVLVDIGGEVRASGRNVGGDAWRLGVNVPRSGADPEAVLVVVPVDDAALATSGDYRNFFEAGGRRYSHIIDPTTGAPVTHQLVSVSVLAKDATTADALATAGLVLGEEKTRQVLAERFPGVEALFVHASEGAVDLKVSKTDGFPVQ